MKLTNKQIGIIRDEIFNKVSQPIIEENNVVLKNISIPDNEYIKAVNTIEKLREKADELENKASDIEDTFKNKIVEGIQLSPWSPCSSNNFRNWKIAHINNITDLKKYPSKNDIEKEIVLAGNKEIPELIKILIKKLSK